MNPFEAIQGRDYDCIAPSINCRADRGGAEIHEIELGSRVVRVLAHSAQEAKSAATDHIFEAGLLKEEPDYTQPLF